MLKEEMDYMGPVRRSDAEKAQQGIISTIMHFTETGEIYVG
jgi:flagellar motor switch protein FliG